MDNNKSNRIIIILSIVALLVISFIAVYLTFFPKKEEKSGPHLDIYKYEVYNGEFKYYTEKIEASKIGLVDTIKYECNDESCYFVKSLYSGGNINDDYTLISDGEDYYLFNIKEQTKKKIVAPSKLDYVQFIDNNKYLLLISNNKYYSYNIKDNTVSNSFNSDIIISNDGKIEPVFGNNLVVIENSKMGIVNLDTGNSTYDSDYTNIECKKDYCLFTIDNSINLYKNRDNNIEMIKDNINEVELFNDQYLVYKHNTDLVVFVLDKEEEIILSKYDFSYKIRNVIIEDTSIELDTAKNGSCYLVKFKNDNYDIVAVQNEFEIESDIFTTSDSRTNFTVTYDVDNKKNYDMKVNTNDSMNDNIGNIYDKLTITKKVESIPNHDKGSLIKDEDAYNYLNELADKLKLTDIQKNYFVNKYLRILLNNRYSEVLVEVDTDNKTYNDITVLSDVGSFKYVGITIKRVTKDFVGSETELEVPKFTGDGLGVLLISELSY